MKLIKSICFLFIGLCLIALAQSVVIPKYTDRVSYGQTENMIKEFDDLSNKDDIQVVFLGSSVSGCAVDPMKIYEDTKIASFNFSSPKQNVLESYYVLKMIFSECNPKYVFFDASSLFENEIDYTSFYYILDTMTLSEEKLELAYQLAVHSEKSDCLEKFLGALFPIINYHDRWKELRSVDFISMSQKKNLFLKGFWCWSGSTPTSINVETMNYYAEKLNKEKGWIHVFAQEASDDIEVDNVLYDPVISDENLHWLTCIKKLCDSKNATLILFKVPNINFPQVSQGAWVNIKSEILKKAATDNDIIYIDYLYDYDIGLDWDKDSYDGGTHLNFTGSNKFTSYIESYLINACKLEGSTCADFEFDLETYEKYAWISELKSCSSLHEYLYKLNERNDLSILMSVSDDMMRFLRDEDIRALKEFGLKTDFESMTYSDSFAAVKQYTDVIYEASGNRILEKELKLKNDESCYIVSTGFLQGKPSGAFTNKTWANAIIKIDGNNYAENKRGLNFVIYDDIAKVVIDTVVFDTWANDSQLPIRSLSKSAAQLYSYEMFLMKNN